MFHDIMKKVFVTVFAENEQDSPGVKKKVKRLQKYYFSPTASVMYFILM